MKLTNLEIAEILDELHERIQFYDSSGEPHNRKVIAEIEVALKEAFGHDGAESDTASST